VGTIAAIKRGAIAVQPAVERLTDAGAVFAGGGAADFDAVVLATGYRAGLEEIVDVPGALDGEGRPVDWNGGGPAHNLYFVGYDVVSTGMLREIARQAEVVAAKIAGEIGTKTGTKTGADTGTKTGTKTGANTGADAAKIAQGQSPGPAGPTVR
jgi:hypothetical protein